MTLYALHGIRPTLPPPGRFWVAPGAHVMGRVKLGVDVGIWFNAVLRGDSEDIVIGAESNVQDGAVLHVDPGFPLTVGVGCTIGHSAILHGCTLGDNTLVGMGATVLNGARIGANCLIGANALVAEGKVFADGSLIVGAPARAIRTLEPEEIERMRSAARIYVERFRHYAGGLTAIDAG